MILFRIELRAFSLELDRAYDEQDFLWEYGWYDGPTDGDFSAESQAAFKAWCTADTDEERLRRC